MNPLDAIIPIPPLTMRQYFAALFMQAILSNNDYLTNYYVEQKEQGNADWQKTLSHDAILFADSLIEGFILNPIPTITT